MLIVWNTCVLGEWKCKLLMHIKVYKSPELDEIYIMVLQEAREENAIYEFIDIFHLYVVGLPTVRLIPACVYSLAHLKPIIWGFVEICSCHVKIVQFIY